MGKKLWLCGSCLGTGCHPDFFMLQELTSALGSRPKGTQKYGSVGDDGQGRAGISTHPRCLFMPQIPLTSAAWVATPLRGLYSPSSSTFVSTHKGEVGPNPSSFSTQDPLQKQACLPVCESTISSNNDTKLTQYKMQIYVLHQNTWQSRWWRPGVSASLREPLQQCSFKNTEVFEATFRRGRQKAAAGIVPFPLCAARAPQLSQCSRVCLLVSPPSEKYSGGASNTYSSKKCWAKKAILAQRRDDYGSIPGFLQVSSKPESGEGVNHLG